MLARYARNTRQARHVACRRKPKGNKYIRVSCYSFRAEPLLSDVCWHYGNIQAWVNPYTTPFLYSEHIYIYWGVEMFCKRAENTIGRCLEPEMLCVTNGWASRRWVVHRSSKILSIVRKGYIIFSHFMYFVLIVWCVGEDITVVAGHVFDKISLIQFMIRLVM